MDQIVPFPYWIVITIPGVFIGSMSARILCLMYNQMYILFIYICELMRQRLLTIQEHLTSQTASWKPSVPNQYFVQKKFSLLVLRCIALHNLVWQDHQKSRHFVAYTIGEYTRNDDDEDDDTNN